MFKNNIETKLINSGELSKTIMAKLFFNMIKKKRCSVGSYSLFLGISFPFKMTF